MKSTNQVITYYYISNLGNVDVWTLPLISGQYQMSVYTNQLFSKLTFGYDDYPEDTVKTNTIMGKRLNGLTNEINEIISHINFEDVNQIVDTTIGYVRTRFNSENIGLFPILANEETINATDEQLEQYVKCHYPNLYECWLCEANEQTSCVFSVSRWNTVSKNILELLVTESQQSKWTKNVNAELSEKNLIEAVHETGLIPERRRTRSTWLKDKGQKTRGFIIMKNTDCIASSLPFFKIVSENFCDYPLTPLAGFQF